jgi:hypothetical protein
MHLPATSDALRHSLDTISLGLNDFVPPSGPFDPARSWTHVYRIWQIMRAPPGAIDGQLTIHRAARGDGALLEVQQQALMMKHYGYGCKASIQCGAGRWSTPRRFTAETWTSAPDGQIEAQSRLKFAAEVVGPEIRFAGGRKPPLRVAADWTLDWALIDALQRLPVQEHAEWILDLVEDCDLLRPRQRLSYVGPLTVSLAGKTTELLGFCHVGPGTLPTHYWLDGQHRLLFAIRMFRALILQSSTSEQEPRT